MAERDGNLQLIAAKSGLGAEENVLRKAEEYVRRLKAKSATSCNISDTAMSVLCLDIAATALGVDFDIKTLIKLSAQKPSQYSNYRKVVENLLELNSDILSVPLLCAQLHCDSAQEVANKVLQQLQKISKVVLDCNIPQYICMAVYQACRINKIKVPKSKFVEKSRLRPGQWSKMETTWTKVVDDHFAVAKKKVPKATQVVNEKEIEVNMVVDDPVQKQDDEMDPPVEPYEDWKRRILAAAYAALDEEEQVTKVSQVNDKRITLIKLKHDVKYDKKSQTIEKHKQLNDDMEQNKSGLTNVKNRQTNDKKGKGTEKRILFDDDIQLADKNYQDIVKSPPKRLVLEFVNRKNNLVKDDRRQSPRKNKVSSSQGNDSPMRRQANYLVSSPRQLTRRQTNDHNQVTDSPRQLTRRQTNDHDQVTDSPRQLTRRQTNDHDQVTDSPRQLTRRQTNDHDQVTDSPRQLTRRQTNDHDQVTDSPRQLTRRQTNDHDQVTDSPRQLTRRQTNDHDQVTDSPRQMTRRQTNDNRQNNDKQGEIADDLDVQMIKIVGSPIKIKTYKNKNRVEVVEDVEMKDLEKQKKTQTNAESGIRSEQRKPIILLNDIFNLSPRRSPRKTPQKYEPYKSPTKTKGVRLLFPCD